MPYLSNSNQAFIDEMLVGLQCKDNDVKIYYTLDGSEPDTSSNPYTSPFRVNQTTTIKAMACKDGAMPSYTFTAVVEKKELKPAMSISENKLVNA